MDQCRSKLIFRPSAACEDSRMHNMTVLLLIALAAFVLIIVNAFGKCPVWIPLVLIAVFQLLQVIPLK